ncbi:MAG: hypothetical protein QOD37_1476 [Gaiellales bacterium]|jgi:hypothetical protein|nr:hypothetical protein [Gaiellales bacterium]MDX6571992.1 hypothetical protein [Gaiellales bacterium]
MAVLQAHMAVGGLFVAINVVVAIWGFLTWRRRWAVSGLLSQLLALSHTLAFLQGAFGLYLLAGGYRAPMELHYVYGLLPSAAVLFGYSARTADSRRNLLQFSIIAVAIAGLGTRAFMTGRGM